MSTISMSTNWPDGAKSYEDEADEPMARPAFEGPKLVMAGRN